MTYIPLFQIGVSILIIALVLLQPRGSGLGSAFGGEGSFFATRRGIQQKLYWLTLVLGFVFIALGILNLIQ
ncbi:MAG: preprotein translocase subunit SecG [Candidatus Wildermuthbacteria bacterium]|nr:preprotein translocase subunit SecG [Candidatus Wildermuthbacteria bacterium]